MLDKMGRNLHKGRSIRSKHAFNPKKIHVRYSIIIQLHMLGWKNVEIADELNITEKSVSEVLNNPLVKNRMALMQASVDKQTVDTSVRINNLIPKALDVYEALLDGEVNGQKVRPTVLRDAAKDVLTAKVEEFNPKKKVTFEHVFDRDDLKEIKEIALKRARENNDLSEVEEAEYSDVSVQQELVSES